MALDFPNNPSDGDTFGNYFYDASKGVWRIFPNIPGIISQFYVDATAPVNPRNGEIWLNSTDGNTYIYYDDGDSAQWIEIGGNTGFPPDLNTLSDVTITSPTTGEALIYDGSEWVNQNAFAPRLLEETTTRTANYTLALTDINKVVPMNGSSLTLTIPLNSSVAFPVGSIVNIYNLASTNVTIAGDSGVTLRNAGALAQYGEASLRKRGTDEWVLAGNVV
jgi:hypothetical protein